MELSYGKLLAAIALSVITFIFSMLPLLLNNRFRHEGRSRNFRVVNFLSCFGAGVFMATCLLHLFPDVQEQTSIIFKQLKLNTNYPFAEFLLAFGFLTVLIVEQIVLDCQEPTVEKLNHDHSHAEPNYQNYGSINEDMEPHASFDAGHSHSILPPGIEPNEEHGPLTHEVSFHQDPNSHSILRSLLLVFALALHSIFEGLAIGLQSSVNSVIRILLAVLIHKSIIAFTLGLNLSNSKLKRRNVIKGNIFFSLTTPIGIIIGLVVVDFVTGIPMLVTSCILQGLAAGTFLYVTFIEVLPHELNSSEDRMIKMGCLVLGFSIVSMLLFFLPS